MTLGSFKIQSRDSCSKARTAVLTAESGRIETPVFMPVGTRGSVKGLTPEQLKQTGTEIILANTYHMMIRPGADTVEQLGGLHRMMAWPGPILTDSGGYQVFSLSSLRRIGDDGVEFASHVDGRTLFIDAETAIKTQNKLGADIIMCFDECPPWTAEHKDLERAVLRTVEWAKICKKAHRNKKQLLFGIVQGGIEKQLRGDCAGEIVSIGFDGYAIGGLSVGEGHENMISTAGFTADLLPSDRPRYLMGVGMPIDIIAAVHAGIDMFDCVLPSRNGRNSFAFTKNGAVRLRNNCHTADRAPIDPDCSCYCCRNFSRGAVRHFFKASEMLGPILTTIHNIHFYQALMREIRQRIEDGSFSRWAQKSIELSSAGRSIAEYKIL